MGGWAIAVHGGAGVDLNLPPQRQEQAKQLLTRCLNIGISALRANASALDVVELVVRNSFLSPSLLHVLPFPLSLSNQSLPIPAMAFFRDSQTNFALENAFSFTEIVFRRVPAWLVLHACTL